MQWVFVPFQCRTKGVKVRKVIELVAVTAGSSVERTRD
jgi:hypothetical protein